MKKIAVIGLGFGDEGKGVVTDYLCSQNPKKTIGVRHSGGHQCGHTVYYGKQRHVFSNLSSGSFREVPTFWGPKCTFELIGFLREYGDFTEKAKFAPQVWINAKSPVTTWMDIRANKQDSTNCGHGSCGVGFGKTIQREEDHYSFLFEDLLTTPKILKMKLNQLREYYSYVDGLEDDYDECVKQFLEYLYSFLLLFRQKKTHIYDTLPGPFQPTYDTVVFEGSQGLLLDKDNGFFPHVTRSNTGIQNIEGSIDELYLVTRAYQTRHGNGPMTNEDIPHRIKENPEETNVSHEYQGEFRRSLLDLELLKYGIMKDRKLWNHYNYKKKNTHLVITCLDHMYDEYGYTDKVRHYCSNEEEFAEAVGDELEIRNVYINVSPYSHTIRKIV